MCPKERGKVPNGGEMEPTIWPAATPAATVETPIGHAYGGEFLLFRRMGFPLNDKLGRTAVSGGCHFKPSVYAFVNSGT